LKATTRLVWSPQLVTAPAPMRIRFPLAPSGTRAGGWISAGMISTVQTPFPILAVTAPKICEHFCAPSPESETTSTVCSCSRRTSGATRDASVLPPTPASFVIDTTDSSGTRTRPSAGRSCSVRLL
jgi:hypothetical protein